MRADESGTAGDDGPHPPRILARWDVFITFEGLDGSGKTTQAAAASRSAARGQRIASFSFPLYDGNPFSRAVADDLNGEFGTPTRSTRGSRRRCTRPTASSTAAARRRARGARSRRLRPLRRSRSRRTRAEARGRGSARLLELEEVEYGERAAAPDRVDPARAPSRRAPARRAQGRARDTTLEADIDEADVGARGATREVYSSSAERNRWQHRLDRATTAAADVAEVAAEVGGVEPLLAMTFAAVAEQAEAKRLLSAALADGPAHAYLLHGPPGVGKRRRSRCLRRRAARRPRARRAAHAPRSLRARAARRPDPDRRHPRAAHATCTCAPSRPTAASTSSSALT